MRSLNTSCKHPGTSGSAAAPWDELLCPQNTSQLEKKKKTQPQLRREPSTLLTHLGRGRVAHDGREHPDSVDRDGIGADVKNLQEKGVGGLWASPPTPPGS